MSRTTALRRSFLVNLLVMVSAVVLLQACGSGKKAPPPVIPDALGYYGNTGTLPALNITDLQAMMTSTRLIMASKARGYYYDGPIVVNGNSITGNLVQFLAPGTENTTTVTLSATINPNDRSISGTVNHRDGNIPINGVSVPFTLSYATGRTDSTLAAVINTPANNPNWLGTIYTVLDDFLTFSLADNTAGAVAITTITPLTGIDTVFQNCVFTGTLTPVAGTSLYEVSFTASNACISISSRGGPYTGLAALRTQTSPNDTLVIAAYFNDGFSLGNRRALFGEFQ